MQTILRALPRNRGGGGPGPFTLLDMDPWAAGIAVIAAGFSGVSAWNARLSRRAAQDARHEARTPRISWTMGQSHPGDPFCVLLTSDRDLDKIVITQEWGTLGDPDVTNWSGINARRNMGMLLRNAAPEDVPQKSNGTSGSMYTLIGHHISMGQTMAVSAMGVGNTMHEQGRLVLRCECIADGEHWTTHIDTGRQPVTWRFV